MATKKKSTKAKPFQKVDKPKRHVSKRQYNQHRKTVDSLTPRETMFVHAYHKTLLETHGRGNAAKACRDMGISADTAGVRGCELMKVPQVRRAIDKLIAENVKKYDLSSNNILQELAHTGFSNMIDYMRVGEDGSAVVDLQNLTREQAAAISQIEVDEYMERTGETDDDGNPTWERVKRVKFKLGDKKGSLELLGRYRKLFTDKVAHENPDGTALGAPVLNIQFLDPPKRK